jgi:hypothetical protein
MSKLYKSIVLINFLCISNAVLAQNIGDTIKIDMRGSEVLIINKNIEQGWDFENEEEESQMKKNKLGVEFLFGTNGYVTQPISIIDKSSYYSTNYLKSFKIGSNILLKGLSGEKERLYFLPGLGLSWNNYIFNNNVQVESINGNTLISVDTLNNYIKSKLHITYLQIPLLLGVRLGNISKNPFGMQVGIEGAYKLLSKTAVKNENGNVQINKRKDSFNLHPFKISALMRLSIGNIGLFGRISLNSLFTSNNSIEYVPISGGIIIAGF